jgi:hypothetical protein
MATPHRPPPWSQQTWPGLQCPAAPEQKVSARQEPSQKKYSGWQTHRPFWHD